MPGWNQLLMQYNADQAGSSSGIGWVMLRACQVPHTWQARLEFEEYKKKNRASIKEQNNLY